MANLGSISMACLKKGTAAAEPVEPAILKATVIKRRACRVASKWKHARTHFVQHCPKGEQVAAGVEFFPSNLLRRHIRDGAERTAGTRQMFLGVNGRGAHGNAFWLQ